MHFAMEDFHGYQKFGSDPKEALRFFGAHTPPQDLPTDAAELYPLGKAILDYYQEWLKHRNEYKTLWIDGVPQVEVRFELPLYEGVQFVGVFDRIVTDSMGRLFVMDYKFVKKFDTAKLALDPQVSAYCLAAESLYGQAFEGMVYMQFKKEMPQPPERLKNGTFSKNKSQATTSQFYTQALIETFGTVPAEYSDFVAYLISQESADGDSLIRRDVVRRNEHQVNAEAQKIMEESFDMTDPNVLLYPNPTRDCPWDCPFVDVCVGMDDGSDVAWMLEHNFAPKRELDWRKQLAEDVQNYGHN